MGSSISIARAEGCPVDHENMSKEQIDAFLSQRQHPPTQQQQQQQQQSQHNSEASSSPSSSGCPVDHENMSKEQIDAFMSSSKHASAVSPPPAPPSPPSRPTSPTPSSPAQPSSPSADGCASSPESSDKVYDVYGQEIDTSNMMPSTPNQLPSPGQRKPLSTDRVRSTIPKGSDQGSGVWVYPSPQMFYNALKRKRKADGVEESDMESVVAVHNRMNERTWEQVLEWEARFHCHECTTPKLKKFVGKPTEISPAATFRMWLRGYPKPFDRHDWTVDRCGLKEVRYIIDYYYMDTEGKANADPIEIHVRPAIDSPSTAYDRLRKGAFHLMSSFGIPTPPVPELRDSVSTVQSRDIQSMGMHTVESIDPSSSSPTNPNTTTDKENASAAAAIINRGSELDAGEFKFLTELTAESVGQISKDVQKQCTNAHAALASATDPAKMEQANISLNYCMAKRICSTQATQFMTALESGSSEDHTSEKYSDMTDCLDRFQIMARRAILEAAGVKQSGPEFPQGVYPSVANTSAKPAAATSAASSSSNEEK